jgi:hypothetical protein
MKHAATSLAALAVVALVAGTVEAKGSSHPKASHAPVTLVKHGGSHGGQHGYGNSYGHRNSHGYSSRHGYRGSHGYGSPYRSSYGYHQAGCGSGYCRPRVHPPVVVNPYVYPSRYPSYGYVYRPSSSFHYRGNGFGLSIGF